MDADALPLSSVPIYMSSMLDIVFWIERSSVKCTLHYDKESRLLSDSKRDPKSWEKANIQNTLRLGGWTGAWVLTLALAAFGPKFLWALAVVPSIVGVLLNLLVGFGMILAVRRDLLSMDEMHRQIFLDASALSLGVGFQCDPRCLLADGFQAVSGHIVTCSMYR